MSRALQPLFRNFVVNMVPGGSCDPNRVIRMRRWTGTFMAVLAALYTIVAIAFAVNPRTRVFALAFVALAVVNVLTSVLNMRSIRSVVK